MNKSLKSERGAIALIVLVTMLFLTAFLMTMFLNVANKAQTSAETTEQIKQKYNNLDDTEIIYQSYFADENVIPIYTVEQLKEIGSGKQIEINGKIYTFATEGYYVLETDLNLGGIYDEETDTWSGTEWEAITTEFTGVLDGIGHEITGIYLGEDEKTNGIFQELKGTVKNLFIKDSYKTTNMNGLIAGTNSGEITNCYYEKILIGLKAGDYVNYTPTEGTYTVSGGESGTGATDVQTFTTETEENALKWRILSIDEKIGEVELISETVGQNLTLKGADGYNHGVDILNDLCEKLYSKTENGEKIATARSINVEDINKKTTYTYTQDEGKIKQLSTDGTDRMKYPKIYSQEIGYGAAGNFNKNGLTDSQGLYDGVTDEDEITTYSTITGYIDGNTEGTEPYVTYTFYNYIPENCLKDLGINVLPKGIITQDTQYFLASRCVSYSSADAGFYLRYMYKGTTVYGVRLFNSGGVQYSITKAIRPVVKLSSNVSFEKDNTNLDNSVTYWDIIF